MTLRQKIENILNQSYLVFGTRGVEASDLRGDVLDEIMNEISKEVYGHPMHGMK